MPVMILYMDVEPKIGGFSPQNGWWKFHGKPYILEFHAFGGKSSIFIGVFHEIFTINHPFWVGFPTHDFLGRPPYIADRWRHRPSPRRFIALPLWSLHLSSLSGEPRVDTGRAERVGERARWWWLKQLTGWKTGWKEDIFIISNYIT